MRSTRKTVTFHRPFRIPGVDGEQPAGEYEVTTDEEQVPGISFVAWRRVGTSMRFPRWHPVGPGAMGEHQPPTT